MSISTFQEKFLRGGCGIAALLSIAAVMLGGVFVCNRDVRQMQDQSEAKPALTVGDVAIPAVQIENAYQQQVGGAQPDSPEGPAVFVELQTLGRTIDNAIDQAALAAIAKERGIQFTDEEILAAVDTAFDQSLQSSRQQLEMMGQLKPGATDKEFEEVLTKQYGKSPADLKKDQVDQIKQRLADPAQRPQMVVAAAPLILIGQERAKVAPNDDQLRQSYDELTTKRILLKNDVPGGSAAERAQKALADVKSGTFEQAIERHSNELPAGNKKISENTQVLIGSELLTDPALRGLLDLKAGEVSGVVDVREGKAIYKVVSRRSNLPKDFDKEKERYRRQFADQAAARRIEEEVKKFKAKPDIVKFQAPGYKALYDFMQATMSPVADMNAKMQQLFDQAMAALDKNEGFDQRAAALAAYGAMTSLYGAPGADIEKLRPLRIRTIESLLQTGESFALRMELANVFESAKQYDEAAQQILAAAQNNTLVDEPYTSEGERRFLGIRQKVEQFEKNNQATEEVRKEIRKELERFSKDRDAAAVYRKEQQKLMEEERKKQEAEFKKQQAESKAATTGSTGSTAPATGSTATGSTATGTTGQ